MLTHDDISLLMEALESIEKAASLNDSMGDLVGGMIGGMLMKDDPEGREKMKRDQDAERVKRAASRRRKQEDVYLLRAKLVQIRRELDGEVADRLLAAS